MRRLEKEELLCIEGGAVSAAFLNAISRAISTVLNLGKTIGSIIRRTTSGNYCSV